MNRKPAEVAKILGVNGSQVKGWVSLFDNYFSDEAKPGKGKDRVFNDTDLLVLMYINHYWEDDPDLECIRVGLNRGDYHDDPFMETLYLHTPLIQDWPEGMDETWRHGILLVGSGRYGYLELARNYRNVAELMLESAFKNDLVDSWAYPVLFAYRHTLELYLKLIAETDEITHSLQRCVQLVEKRWNAKLPAPIRGWILELDQIDRTGTAFRYSDADAGLNQHYERWFDFHHFKFAMNRVFDTIDRAVLDLGSNGKLQEWRLSRL